MKNMILISRYSRLNEGVCFLAWLVQKGREESILLFNSGGIKSGLRESFNDEI
jgi:hypothetical protein